MNRFIKSDTWAREVFGEAQLGHAKRARRLVHLAGSLADATGASPAKASVTPADLEGAYRFLRNEAVDAEAIVQAGCAATGRAAGLIKTLLAIEDTTTLRALDARRGCRDRGDGGSSGSAVLDA